MDIKSNHHKRELLDSYNVPENILKSQFDWLDGSYGFIHYRNTWYHTSQFMRVEHGGSLDILGYSGYHNDTYFSGVLLKVFDDGLVSVSSYYC